MTCQESNKYETSKKKLDQCTHLHSCLAREFHQQKHELYHPGFYHSKAYEAKFHWYRKANVYSCLSFPLTVLYTQPVKKIYVERQEE